MTRTRRALIVIDVQQEYFDGPLAVQHPPRETSVANVAAAIDAAEAAGLPIVAVQHQAPASAPVFAEGSVGWRLHPDIERRATTAWKRSAKQVASVFADESVVSWLRERDVETVTLVGYMTNNCVIGSAAAAEPLGFAVEVLSDATGAIHLSNEIGTVPAKQVHETLMVLLHSNFAAVSTTAAWSEAVPASTAIATSDLVTSAIQGAAASERG